MAEERVQKNLAAIMVADVVGYRATVFVTAKCLFNLTSWHTTWAYS